MTERMEERESSARVASTRKFPKLWRRRRSGRSMFELRGPVGHFCAPSSPGSGHARVYNSKTREKRRIETFLRWDKVSYPIPGDYGHGVPGRERQLAAQLRLVVARP